jgi:hypothetical protein
MNIGLDCSLSLVRRVIAGNILDARKLDEKDILEQPGAYDFETKETEPK